MFWIFIYTYTYTSYKTQIQIFRSKSLSMFANKERVYRGKSVQKCTVLGIIHKLTLYTQVIRLLLSYIVRPFSCWSRRPNHFSCNATIYRIPGSRYSVPRAKVFDNVGSLTADAYTPLENCGFCSAFKTYTHTHIYRYTIYSYNNAASAENCSDRFYP